MGRTIGEYSCDYCGKKFKRDASMYKYQIKKGKKQFCSSSCSSKYHGGGSFLKGSGKTVEKTCYGCGKVFTIFEREVRAREKRGHKLYCSKDCAMIKGGIRLYEYNHQNETEKMKKFKPLLQRTQNTHKDRQRINPRFKDLEYNLTIDYIAELWEQQDGKCYFSGIPLEITQYYNKRMPMNPFQASIDRIDNNKGYIQGNVRIVSVIGNFAKNRFSDEDLITFCHGVASQHKRQTTL